MDTQDTSSINSSSQQDTSMPDLSTLMGDHDSASTPLISSDSPKKTGERFPRFAIILLLIFAFVTTAVMALVSRQRSQIADIRNQAAYPGCSCASEGATSCGANSNLTEDNTCPSGKSCCSSAGTCMAVGQECANVPGVRCCSPLICTGPSNEIPTCKVPVTTCASGWSCGAQCASAADVSNFNGTWCDGKARWLYESGLNQGISCGGNQSVPAAGGCNGNCATGSQCYLQSASQCSFPSNITGQCTTSSGAQGLCCKSVATGCPSGSVCMTNGSAACQTAGGNTGITCQLTNSVGSCCKPITTPTPVPAGSCPTGTGCFLNGSAACQAAGGNTGIACLTTNTVGSCCSTNVCTNALSCTRTDNPDFCCSGLSPVSDSSCASGKRCSGGICRQDCLISGNFSSQFCNGLDACSCVNPGTLSGTCTSALPQGLECVGKSLDSSCTISGTVNGQPINIGGMCKPDGAGGAGSFRCDCIRACGTGGGTNPTNTPTPTVTPIAPTNPGPTNPGPTNPPANTPTRTPTQTPTRTPTPSVTNTPTATPVIGQCLNIKIYKNNVIVTNPNTLLAGDNIVIAVVGTNATQARIKINNETTWRVITTQTNGEWTYSYQIPTSGVTSFSITAELFIGGVWQ